MTKTITVRTNIDNMTYVGHVYKFLFFKYYITPEGLSREFYRYSTSVTLERDAANCLGHNNFYLNYTL